MGNWLRLRRSTEILRKRLRKGNRNGPIFNMNSIKPEPKFIWSATNLKAKTSLSPNCPIKRPSSNSKSPDSMNNLWKKTKKSTEWANKYLCKKWSTPTGPVSKLKPYPTRYSPLRDNYNPLVIQFKICKDKTEDWRFKWKAAGLNLLNKIMLISIASRTSRNSRSRTTKSTGKSCNSNSNSINSPHKMTSLDKEPINSNNNSAIKIHKSIYWPKRPKSYKFY